MKVFGGAYHVLLNPDGHGLMTTWASETKQIMDEQILQELNYFSPFYKSKIPNFFIEEIIYEESSIEKQNIFTWNQSFRER